MVYKPSRGSLRALIAIYSQLLDRIITANYEVLASRIRVPTWQKLWILLRNAF
jgi:phytoene/squalene synthetase